MICVDVVVHRVGITGKEFCLRWEVEKFNFIQHLLAVLHKGWHGKFELLEPIIEPFTPIISKSTAATNDRSRLPRLFVDFSSHSETSKFARISLPCAEEEGFFSITDANVVHWGLLR